MIITENYFGNLLEPFFTWLFRVYSRNAPDLLPVKPVARIPEHYWCKSRVKGGKRFLKQFFNIYQLLFVVHSQIYSLSNSAIKAIRFLRLVTTFAVLEYHEFSIVRPTGFLKNFIKHYCFMESDFHVEDVIERVIPTENIQLMFHYKAPFVVLHPNDALAFHKGF